MQRRGSRREFLVGAGASSAVLLAGCALPFSAPPAAKVHRIAYLTANSPSGADDARLAAFRQGMRDLGYAEGENLLIERRYASGFDGLADPAAELVRLQPEVILVAAVAIARAVLAAPTTIPIVSAGAGDLVANGLAASHARPGGNVTGLSTPDLTGKQLQLFQEVVPSLARVAILFDPTNPEGGRREPYETAAHTLGLQLQFVGVGGPEDLERWFETATHEHADGVFLSTGSVTANNQIRIAELALLSRLPSMWPQSEAVGRGGLMAYGPNRADQYRRAAYYVDRILKGTKPDDLPVEQPMRFDFVVNLKTAAALGITFPNEILLQVTEVIQ
jgi:putative tryptophan/tyrosine transport system substrate-binding protein